MKALVFGVDPEPGGEALGPDAPRLRRHLATTPMALEDVDDPGLIADDWLVLRTRMCGICGSDTKQVLMDFDDGADNAMSAFISFPQVLGHEVVADVVDVGPAVGSVEPGQRVVLNPWLSCRPRGIEPVCRSCDTGDFSLCEHFHDGRLSPGIHTGNCKEATGGFGELLPAHESMVIPVPESVPDDVAVLADPFAVSLHAITRNPPARNGRAIVYGAGALGTTATAILRSLHPDVDVATIAKFPAQRALAESLGAVVFDPEPRDALVEALAEWSGGILRQPFEGLPVAYPGGVDTVYDTVGSPETIEVGIRLLASRGTLVQLGVSAPGRFEWAPWYFKELRLVGSNAFGIEEVEGKVQHGIAHYLDLVERGRVDLTGVLTHTFRIEEWRRAFETLIAQGDTGAIKVAFDWR